MRRSLFLSAFVACLLYSIAASAQQRMDIIDFLVSWRDLKGSIVHIDSCVIAGITSSFLRCETANRAGQIILDVEDLSKADHRFALENCPTGTGHSRAICTVSVTGKVSPTRREPTLSSVKFVK